MIAKRFLKFQLRNMRNVKILTGLLEHKARCYLRNNSFDEAKDIFVQMIRLTPSDWRVHYQLANAYHENNKKYKAISTENPSA